MKKLKLEELGRISASDYKDADKLPVVLVLDNIRSLHNVGSAFRTADAFLIEKLFLTGITGTPPHREIQKTALGATDSVPWEYVKDTSELLETLKKSGHQIVIVEQTTESVFLQQFRLAKGKKYAFVFGNEVDGVADSAIPLADFAIQVPQGGSKHSLNVSVCLGIVTWQIFQQLRL
jgi:23S rRNA (guanosine2251-2'-O)-methyltransferase